MIAASAVGRAATAALVIASALAFLVALRIRSSVEFVSAAMLLAAAYGWALLRSDQPVDSWAAALAAAFALYAHLATRYVDHGPGDASASLGLRYEIETAVALAAGVALIASLVGVVASDRLEEHVVIWSAGVVAVVACGVLVVWGARHLANEEARAQ